MEKKKYSIVIEAPRERVWDVLWGDKSYEEWTSVFSESSTVKTDWQEGSKVYFLNAEGEGMVAIINKKVPCEYMSFKHVGLLKDGVEDLDSDEVAKWAGSTENYTLKKENNKTELVVDMDIDNSYLEFFDKTWPEAMDKIKFMAEGKNFN